MELKPHTLVKFDGVKSLTSDLPSPEWLPSVLCNCKIAVIRRDVFRPGLVPVGIRGRQKAERFGAWLSIDSIVDIITPNMLTKLENWQSKYAFKMPDPVWSLKEITPVLDSTGFCWGPTGSTAFELATGKPSVRMSSDLDLVIDMFEPLDSRTAANLLYILEITSKSNIDVQLETPMGGVSLREYVTSSRVMVKSSSGPFLEEGHLLWTGKANQRNF